MLSRMMKHLFPTGHGCGRGCAWQMMMVWEEENYRRERGREEKRKQPLSYIEVNGLIKQAQIFGAHSESVGFGRGINETRYGRRERKEIKRVLPPTFSFSISF